MTIEQLKCLFSPDWRRAANVFIWIPLKLRTQCFLYGPQWTIEQTNAKMREIETIINSDRWEEFDV